MFTRTLAALALIAVAAAVSAQDNKPIPGLGPVGPVKKLHGDFKFTEGPAVEADGGVYFTDIPNEQR